MTKKVFSAIAFLFACTLVAAAQQSGNGNKVKRITFDREQVNVEYTDGAQQQNVSTITVKREAPSTPTGIAAAKVAAKQQGSQWYSLDGRSVERDPRQKGVYIVRDEKGVKKVVKR